MITEKIMDPFDVLKFCPKCGKSEWAAPRSGYRKCLACGYEMYKNPTIGAASFLFDTQNRLILLCRAKNPGKGLLGVPGGFCEVGESIEQAVLREAKEETNLDIKIEKFLFSIPNNYEYKGIQLYPLDFFFLCRVEDLSPLQLDLNENSEIVFVDPFQVKTEDIALESIRQGLERLKQIL